jgi:hypothetical protein
MRAVNAVALSSSGPRHWISRCSLLLPSPVGLQCMIEREDAPLGRMERQAASWSE